jgi:phage tail protein X
MMVEAQRGDTFERIARRVYGDDRQARRIRSSNPGLSEPLREGTRVYAPRKRSA